MKRPYSEACDQNREVILAAIHPLLEGARAVLELGSGTGQHAVYFGAAMPHLTWHTSDLPLQHPGIRQWVEAANLENVRPPVALDVLQPQWPNLAVDAVFTANTFHIMPAEAVEAAITGSGRVLDSGGRLLVYGPFNYGNRYTSESNARFDQWLTRRDPLSGLRNFEDLDAAAVRNGLELERDLAMPANNRILCWRKRGRVGNV